MSAIFYTTRAVAGRECKTLMQHIKCIEGQNSVIDFLSTTKTDASKNIIKSYNDMFIRDSRNIFGEYYLSTAMYMADWMEVYDSLDVSTLSKYSNLYIIGGIDLWRAGFHRQSNRVGVFPKDKGQLTWKSAGIHAINLLALLKAHREYDIPLHEVSVDPNEMAVNLFNPIVATTDKYFSYHGYDIPKYNMHRLDSVQYFYNNRKQSTLDSQCSFTKKYDFTFGYTVLENSGRESLVNSINTVANSFGKSNIFVKNASTNENTLVDNDVYHNFISMSRFTYMLPSYNATCFSIYRLIRALYYDCLPLIHSSCNIVDVNNSFGVDLSPLVTDVPMAEKERVELLEYLKPIFLTPSKYFIK